MSTAAITQNQMPSANGDAAADIEAAAEVLRTEAGALTALAASLGSPFTDAIDRILRVPGRVIVTGIGKSGHVARKIAATLASTGTPAFFVHPGEASHGDLGMLTDEDAVLALSNSGNTAELADIVAYAKRYGIPLIGLTGVAGSPLADRADVALILPAAAEACPLGLAPTTSTTMMMALGDALAIALLRRRGFTHDDYRVLHPGGALGRRLLMVSDIMHSGDELPLAGPQTPMSEALVEMSAKSFGCVGIVDAAGALVGIITDGDLRRHMDDDLMSKPAHSVMTAGPRTIRPDALAVEALSLMNDRSPRITCLFVTDKRNRPTGIVHVHDCLRAGVA